MKKILLVVFIAMVAVCNFTGCEKDSVVEKQKGDMSILENFSYETIDAISEEISAFHYNYMTFFLSNGQFQLNELDSISFNGILNSIHEYILDYSFNEIVLPESSSEMVSSTITFDFYKKVNYFSTNSYSFNSLSNSSYLPATLQSIDLARLSDFFSSIDKNVCNIIEESQSFEDFTVLYANFVQVTLHQLKADGLKEDYFYAKLFSDVYVSSLDYIANYLCDQSKGPRWDRFKGMLKEAWEIARPIVAADAGGAVVGAMAGSVSGPGLVATGMAGACGASAGKCVENLVVNGH